jgi:hypothetical protein
VAATCNRRRFLLGASALGSAAWLPAGAIADGGAVAASADWTVDDMWGVHTRYAEAIGFGRSVTHGPLVTVDPVDAPWCQ